MAIHIVVAVRDKAAEFFQAPFVVPARGVATRAFADQVNSTDENNQFAKHPTDFALYELASYNDANGFIDTLEMPVLLLDGEAAINK